MDTIDFILKRRSIRKYLDKTVDVKYFDLLLRAAMSAPSAGNKKPWEFIVVNNPDSMAGLRNSIPANQYNAPAAIVVCGNMNRTFPDPNRDYWVLDCSAATQNILLAAAGLGLGSVWVGVYPNKQKIEAVCKTLDTPAHVIPLAIVYIGYADEKKDSRTQYHNNVIFWQTYNKSQ